MDSPVVGVGRGVEVDVGRGVRVRAGGATCRRAVKIAGGERDRRMMFRP
jgi:hypothetical protein